MKEIKWKKLWLGIGFIFSYMLLIPLFIVFVFSWFSLDDKVYVVLANLSCYIISLGFLIFFYRKSLKKDLIDFQKHFGSYFKIAIKNWFLLLLCMLCCNSIILNLLQGSTAANESLNRDLITSLPIFSCISMVILAPMIEELLFRKGFKDVFPKKYQYLFFSSFLFGFAHIVASLNFESVSLFLENLPQCLYIISYGGMGYFLAKAYDDTNNIFTSILVHTIHNSFSLIIIFIGMVLV